MMKSVTKEKVFHVLKLVLLAVTVTLVLLSLLGTVAHASGLVDDTVNADNLYSKYPLSNYQLDFYVDNSWSWLPWNWLDGIGKSVQYGLYCITNFVWTISLYLSNATGYVVQQAYKLDFINDMADGIGKSIQTLAGVTEHGFSSSGFYVGFLLIIILIVGVYTAYTGLLKRETSKALHAVINFVVVFIVSASFIAYAPNYIQKINDFSSDISTASLDLGTKIMLPDSQSKGKDSVDLIRDSLFAIQVEKPWLLLQFGNSDTEEIGTDRVEALVSASPSDEDGETRENVVKAEIEDNDNDNLTIPQVVNRLGMVFFLLIFNLGITIFIFLLTGMMLFSQILFIIYAMFLPVSFLLSMIPTYENMAKQAVVRVFNVIMTRAGITLIVTVAFSISSMFYNISTDYPFFMVVFFQIICFAGIYMKLGELMSIRSFFHTKMMFPFCRFPFGLKTSFHFPTVFSCPVIIVERYIPCSTLFIFVRRHDFTSLLICLNHTIKFFFIVFSAYSSGNCNKSFCFQFFIHLPHQFVGKWYGNAQVLCNFTGCYK